MRQNVCRLRTVPRRALGSCLAGVSLAFLVGCSGPGLSGRVIEGPASVVVVVDANDERLSNAGVSGAEVRIAAGEGPGASVVATTTTKPDGTFEVALDKASAARPLAVSITREGHVPARGQVYWPGGDRQVLGVLKAAR